ncbi:unnamed protein product [Alopecurus aequalis]
MALRCPSSATPEDVHPRDSRPADSLPPTSQGQGGSSNGAKADVPRKTEEVDHLLTKLEKEGVGIDGKIASIIDDGLARIKDEAMRENIKEPSNGMVILLTIASVAIGFFMGIEWEENSLRKKFAKRRRA